MKARTKDLYTTSDVAQVRAILIQEQDQCCAITGLHTELRDFVCDHKHDEEQLVRGALHKHANSLLGRIEGLEPRYLRHWYPHSLPEFLRGCADYLEQTEIKPDRRWRHPNWTKKVKTKFNALNEKQKNKVLVLLGGNERQNATERKSAFNTILLTKKYSYDTIMLTIKQSKGD